MSAPQQLVYQCGACYGTGRNKRGGPCKPCRATGRVSKGAAVSRAVSDGAMAISQMFYAIVALAVLVAIVVAVIH